VEDWSTRGPVNSPTSQFFNHKNLTLTLTVSTAESEFLKVFNSVITDCKIYSDYLLQILKQTLRRVDWSARWTRSSRLDWPRVGWSANCPVTRLQHIPCRAHCEIKQPKSMRWNIVFRRSGSLLLFFCSVSTVNVIFWPGQLTSDWSASNQIIPTDRRWRRMQQRQRMLCSPGAGSAAAAAAPLLYG